jgi:sulfite reductase beta subunit-like hemoprotein
MRNFWIMILAGVMLLAASSVGMTRAQGSTNMNDQIVVPPSNGPRGVQGQTTMVARQQQKLAETATTERQKQLSDEAAKLLQLATELKAAVDKSNKNEMSLEVIRKADDVEKLAHDLKLKMRT